MAHEQLATWKFSYLSPARDPKPGKPQLLPKTPAPPLHCASTIMMRKITTNALRTSIAALQSTETVIPAPHPFESPHATPVPEIPKRVFPKHGNGILLVIPTANKHKTRILTEVFEKQKPPGVSTISYITVPAESDVGEQPYGLEAGVQGARNRIDKALQGLVDSKGSVIREMGIGTVMAASIENFIQRPRAGDGCSSPVDYGVVMVYNATTGKAVVGVSRGVTVPILYFEHALELGYVGGNENYGRVAVGDVLAAHVAGLDRADWHSVVSGVSRYDLLREVFDSIVIPW